VEDITITNNGALSNIDVLGELAQFLGIEVRGIKPITMTRETVVENEDTEKHKLLGKVEAYENILIGREVSICK
jgi:hypothetical protein